MKEWSRPYWTREDMEGLNDDESLYLIPTYDTDAEALDRLRDRYPLIFAEELELWCQDQNLWPSPRPFELFQRWFRVRFFHLVEDLGGEPLRLYQVDGDFEQKLRNAWDGVGGRGGE